VGGVFILAEDEKGFERAAPVRTLVQKLRAGEQFLARGRIHARVNAPEWVWAHGHLGCRRVGTGAFYCRGEGFEPI